VHPLRRFLSDRLAAAGLVIVLLLTVAAVLAPLLAPHDPTVINPLRGLEGSSGDHPLGTDELGRDVLSRLLFGARWSLGIAALATVSVMLTGTIIGLLAGYFGRWVDTVIMRIVDALLALPNLVLYLAIIGTLGPGIRNVFIALVSIWVRLFSRDYAASGMTLSA
jgi:peptide/nickel transport system permease protein